MHGAIGSGRGQAAAHLIPAEALIVATAQAEAAGLHTCLWGASVLMTRQAAPSCTRSPGCQAPCNACQEGLPPPYLSPVERILLPPLWFEAA